MQKLRSKLLEAFYNWIKLKIPEDVIQNMPQNYPELMKLIFNELENKDENLENATNCVIELLILSRKNPAKFSQLRELVVSKVNLLIGRVNQAVKEKDENLGDQLTDIFVELGKTYIEKIIDSGDLVIPDILLSLISIPEVSKFFSFKLCRVPSIVPSLISLE